jgi:hypothetical protein
MRKVAQQKDEVMTQSLAIASVGVARGYFKDIENPLKDNLHREMQHAGVRGASRIISRAFAQDAFAFNKSVFDLAAKLAVMPEEVRAGYVEALDMTSEDITDNPFGTSDGDLSDTAQHDIASDEFGADESMDDEFIEDDVEQASQVTAFSRPAIRVSASQKSRLLDHRATGYSVAASEILSGKKPFSFGM